MPLWLCSALRGIKISFVWHVWLINRHVWPIGVGGRTVLGLQRWKHPHSWTVEATEMQHESEYGLLLYYYGRSNICLAIMQAIFICEVSKVFTCVALNPADSLRAKQSAALIIQQRLCSESVWHSFRAQRICKYGGKNALTLLCSTPNEAVSFTVGWSPSSPDTWPQAEVFWIHLRCVLKFLCHTILSGMFN